MAKRKKTKTTFKRKGTKIPPRPTAPKQAKLKRGHILDNGKIS